MAKAIDEKIPDISTPWEGYAGSRVEEFIKEQLGEKFGYINLRFNESENMYHIETFASEEDFKLYDSDKDAYKDLLLQDARIPISTVTGDSYTALLSTNISNTAAIVTSGDVFEIPLNYRPVKIGQLGNENANASGTLHVQRRVGEGEWTDALTIKNILIPLDPTNAETFLPVDIGKALINGRMQIRVRASFDYEAEDGSTKTINTVWVLIGQQVTKTDLRIELKTDYSQPITLKDINGNYENFKIDYFAHGDAEKTIHVKAKGSTSAEYTTSVYSNNSGEVITAVNVNTSGSDGYGLGTHGVKTVEVYMTCDDGLGGTLRSNTLVNQFMVATDEENTNSYLLLQNVTSNAVNYMQSKICEYSVYNPDKEGRTTVAFLVANESGNTEYFRLEQDILHQTQNELVATIEIETESTADSYAFFRVKRITDEGDKNFIYESTGISDYSIIVDNKSAFMPVAGATFHVNPKVRSNNEANPARILNAKNNNSIVDSVFEGFGFVTDGWIENLGQRVLRVPAGGRLTIKRNIFEKFRNQPNSRMSFELDFAVHNVTNTTDPIIDITDGEAEGFRGIRMNAIDGWICSKTSKILDDCLFSWQEGVRTHILFNIEREVKPQGPDVTYNGDYTKPTDVNDSTKVITSVPIARIFINGVLSREIPFSTTDSGEWTNGTCDIIIGNEGCDIDIYNMRAYEGDTIITPTTALLRNYISSLTTSDEKQDLYRRNNITDESGRITLDKALAIGLNCMVWHGTLVSKINSEEYKGYYDYYRYDENGNFLPEHSGSNCKETKSMKIKGQGSTAKTYYDWNIQDDNSKIKFTFEKGIWVPLSKLHSSIEVGEKGVYEIKDGDKVKKTVDGIKIRGGNLGKNFPVDEKFKEYPYDAATDSVQVPDGWFDGNGMYRGSGYMVSPNTALAQKKVIKINYASSMQNHLLGACKTYDLLHRKVVGDTPLQQQVPTAVAAKHTEPFLLFHEIDGKVYFKGLGTYGAGKMDKVAWGFAKDLHPEFALIEGSDNNQTMTDFRVPFDKITAVYNMSEEFWQYGTAGSWDFDGGNTVEGEDVDAQIAEGWQIINPSEDGPEAPTATVRDRWALVANYVYLHGTNIDWFDGTYSQFMTAYSSASDAEKAAINRKKWWFTVGEGEYQAYHLYRYDELNKDTKPWINAGLLNKNGIYQAINLKTDSITKSAYESNTGRHTEMNEAFKQAYIIHMHDTIKYIFNEDSLIFNYCYVLMFLAGSDNSSKNTYFKICPVAESFEANESFNNWYKTMWGLSSSDAGFDFKNCYRVYLDGDDMDSILRTNNNSHQTKPYYIERRFPYADTDPNKEDCLYEGMHNVLFNYVEGYAKINEDVLPNMMSKILSSAQSLVAETDNLLGNPISKVSAWGFLHKYFFNTQYYFPQVCYNEQARIRYEFPHMINYVSTGDGARSIKPITQSLGSQLDNELQYMTQRLVYMASFGRWSSLCGAGGTLGIGGGNEPTFSLQGGGTVAKFVLKPHQYIFPSFNVGTSSINTNIRLSPTETFEYSLNTSAAGDAGFGLYGINYYNSIGNIGDFYVPKGNVIVQGKRLREFIAEPTKATAEFKPEGVTVNASQLIKFSMKGCSNFGGDLNLSTLTRCQELDLRGTKSKSVIMPTSNLLHTVRMGADVRDFSIQDLPKLSTLTFEDYAKIQNFVVGENVGGINTATHVGGIYTAQKNQATPAILKVDINNVDWTNFSQDILRWYAELNDNVLVRFKGIIRINEPNSTTPSISFDTKNLINKRFGNVDDVNSEYHQGLLLVYLQRVYAESGTSIKGAFYISDEPTGDFKFTVVPSPLAANTQTRIKYSVEPEQGVNASYTINEDTGTLTVLSVGDEIETIKIKAIIDTFQNNEPRTIVAEKQIDLYKREARAGDIVYFDGSYSAPEDYDGTKTPVGICFYVAPRAKERVTVNGVTYEKGEIISELFNPNDKMKRLMVALENISPGNTCWGAIQINTSDGTTSYGVRWDLAESLWDISTIPPVSNYADNAVTVEMRPQNTDDQLCLLNDGFKYYNRALNKDHLFASGFGYGENASYINARTFKNTTEATSKRNGDLLALTDGRYVEGDIVNEGYINTLKIIYHRNNILTNNLYHGFDADGNGELNDIVIPANSVEPPMATGNTTEFQDLENAIIKMTNLGSELGLSNTVGLLYPAASACYAYEPKASGLVDKFKRHNWFLPTTGLLARMIYYTKISLNNGDINIFDQVIFKTLPGYLSASNEYNFQYAAIADFNANSVYPTGMKRQSYGVRPVCAF